MQSVMNIFIVFKIQPFRSHELIALFAEKTGDLLSSMSTEILTFEDGFTDMVKFTP